MTVAPPRRRPDRQGLSGLREAVGGRRARRHGSQSAPRAALARLPPSVLPLAGVLALSAVMNTWALSRNGYANAFYSAGVKSMLHSLHNFLYLSSDPGGLVSIDKPPLSLWLQVASAKVFGLSPLSLLLPEAIAGVLTVLVIYLAMRRPFGEAAALLGALCLAVFPSFVAIARDNNPDALMILLMAISCLVALRAIESGRLRTIVACGILVGLAFNVKTLAAFLVVPGIAIAYLACAPGSMKSRFGKLLLAGLAMAVVSLAWMTFVDLTPAGERPYVGSSKHNSELGLTFEYNGLGRLEGQLGGPKSMPESPGAFAPLSMRAGPERARGYHVQRTTKPPEVLPDGRQRRPTAFGASPGPTRLVEGGEEGKPGGLGGQAGWLLPLALAGLIAAAATIPASKARGGERPAGEIRRDPRLAALIVLGGWFLVEAVVLSYAKGIVHPYYTSAMAPGLAAMVGAGAVAFLALARRRSAWALLLPLALAATVYVQTAILDRNHYMSWLPPLLIAGAAVGVLAMLAARRAAPYALAGVIAALLIAPAAWSAATWEVPVQGTFPEAGPRAAAGYGGVELTREKSIVDHHLLAYISHHRAGSRFSVLTVSSVTSSPLILLGAKAAALAGYSGDDPAVSAKRFARMVASGEARYVVLGGPYASRGGNGALRATLAACRMLPASAWGGIRTSQYSLMLFDCAGRAKRIAAAA